MPAQMINEIAISCGFGEVKWLGECCSIVCAFQQCTQHKKIWNMRYGVAKTSAQQRWAEELNNILISTVNQEMPIKRLPLKFLLLNLLLFQRRACSLNVMLGSLCKAIAIFNANINCKYFQYFHELRFNFFELHETETSWNEDKRNVLVSMKPQDWVLQFCCDFDLFLTWEKVKIVPKCFNSSISGSAKTAPWVCFALLCNSISILCSLANLRLVCMQDDFANQQKSLLVVSRICSLLLVGTVEKSRNWCAVSEAEDWAVSFPHDTI